MIQFSIDLLAVILELLIYAVFFHHFLGKTKFAAPIMALIYGAVGVLSMVVSYCPVPDMVHRFSYIAVIVLLALCYQGQLFVKLLVPFVFQAASIAVEKSYAMILGPMRMAMECYGAAGFQLYYFTGVVLSNLTILLMVKLLGNGRAYLFVRRQDLDYPVYFAVLFAVPVCMLYCIDQTGSLMMQTGNFSLPMVITVILLTALTAAFLLLFDVLLQGLERKRQIEVLGKQLELEQEYHTILLDKHQQFQALRHDMKQNMSNIANLIKNEHYSEAMQYAQDQCGQLAQTAVIQTGHPLMDTILTVKESQARQCGAQMQSYVAAELEVLPLDIGDVASICSNALSNAIEAVEQIEDTDTRKIWFQMVQDAGYLHIVVRNTTVGEVKIQNNQILTTKEDKIAHGFGLQIIQRITAKYEGTCTLEYHSGMFSMKVLLPTNMKA